MVPTAHNLKTLVSEAPSRPPVGRPVALPSAETARLYASDWRAFRAWCLAAGQTAFPATPESLACYLLAQASVLTRGALGRHAAAIRAIHRRHGVPVPCLSATARAALRTASCRVSSRSAVRLGPDTLRRMAAGCPSDLAGQRDRALMLLLALPNMSRARIVGLQAEQFRWSAAGATLTWDDAAGRAECDLPRSPVPDGCAVHALDVWLKLSTTRFGPVFRKVDRWGTLEHHALGTDAIRRILINRAGCKATPVRRTAAPRGILAGSLSTKARPT